MMTTNRSSARFGRRRPAAHLRGHEADVGPPRRRRRAVAAILGGSVAGARKASGGGALQPADEHGRREREQGVQGEAARSRRCAPVPRRPTAASGWPARPRSVPTRAPRPAPGRAARRSASAPASRRRPPLRRGSPRRAQRPARPAERPRPFPRGTPPPPACRGRQARSGGTVTVSARFEYATDRGGCEPPRPAGGQATSGSLAKLDAFGITSAGSVPIQSSSSDV